MNEKLCINVLNNINLKKDSYQKKTVFNMAIENENIEVIKLLLTNDMLDINIKSVSNINI